MRVGVVWPQTEVVGDPVAVRDLAQAVEGLGFAHVLAYDHVLGANRRRERGHRFAYDIDDGFAEPLTMFAYLAGLTTRLELATGVVVAPQRQTALLAKQAADVQLLSGGRLRLGVGIGWNFVEYEALGQDFTSRGRRLDEQLRLLRQLWREAEVEFRGEFDTVLDAAIRPRPTPQIPLWVAGTAQRGLRRVARFADGWLPLLSGGFERDRERFAAQLAEVHRLAAEEGRDAAALGVECRVPSDVLRRRGAAELRDWADAGATHLSAVITTGRGFGTVAQHVAELTACAAAAEVRPA